MRECELGWERDYEKICIAKQSMQRKDFRLHIQVAGVPLAIAHVLCRTFIRVDTELSPERLPTGIKLHAGVKTSLPGATIFVKLGILH